MNPIKNTYAKKLGVNKFIELGKENDTYTIMVGHETDSFAQGTQVRLSETGLKALYETIGKVVNKDTNQAIKDTLNEHFFGWGTITEDELNQALKQLFPSK